MQPTFEEEMNRFKAIIRNIARQEIDEVQAKWFRMEERCKFRRLASLGVNGHRAAVGALCDISKEEEAKIIKSILKQKVVGNA